MPSDPPFKRGGRLIDDDGEATNIVDLASVQKELGARSSQAAQAAYLVVLAGSNVGEMHKVEAGETVIGRAVSCNVRLNDDGISRRHARVVSVGGQVIIEDLQSANGTVVNSEIVTQRTLKDGDKIRLGSTTILKFTYQDKLDESFQQKMYDAALRDGLTKAYNKKFFLERFETEFAYARRHRMHLSLVMFDVDHFKRVNDNYGHLAGDAVLMKLAKISQNTIRTEDVFARYGGEEFAVICRGIPLLNAGILGERIRTAVEATVFDYDGQRLPVTISVGVAALPETPADTSAQLIAASDAALYESKKSGRNRVTLKDLQV
jgi:diguanylate cyclase (GGDEF)-like protein